MRKNTRTEKDATELFIKRAFQFIVYRAVRFVKKYNYDFDGVMQALNDDIYDDRAAWEDQQAEQKKYFGISSQVFKRLSLIRFGNCNSLKYERFLNMIVEKFLRFKSYYGKKSLSYRGGKYCKMYILSDEQIIKLAERYLANPNDPIFDFESDYYDEPVKREIRREDQSVKKDT